MLPKQPDGLQKGWSKLISSAVYAASWVAKNLIKAGQLNKSICRSDCEFIVVNLAKLRRDNFLLS